MTVWIDPPNAPGHGRLWSHLASDVSFAELHAFAATVGVPRRRFDRDHYDIPAEWYDAVVAAGAHPCGSRELVSRLRRAGLRRRKSDTLGPRRPGRTLVRPRRLRPGDTVAVVAPSGPVASERLEAGLQTLRSWGLSVVESPHLRDRHPALAYLAGEDSDRAADLTEAWCDPAVRAVLCARGGYGAQRTVAHLDFDLLARAGPTLLVGFSDSTVLHQAVADRLGLASVHGPSAGALATGEPVSAQALRTLLFGDREPEPLRSQEPPVVPGRAQGVLVGGNLALLAAGVGGSAARPASDSLAVLEDVGEAPYRLDRMLTQLLTAGWFDGVRGVAVGRMRDCGDPATVRRVLGDRLGPLGVPVLSGLPFGHDEPNLALGLGVPAALDAGSGTLTPGPVVT